MSEWLIIRTEYGKEQYVARAIQRLGYDAWAPMDVRIYPITPHRRVRSCEEVPLIPTVAFAATGKAVEADLASVRYCDGPQRNMALDALVIPGNQLLVFRAMVENDNERHRAWARRPAGRRPKRTVVKLDPANIPELMDVLFGGET